MPMVLFAAPSGAGKTTLARRVMALRPKMRFSVSATTRPPRAGERDGHDYHFVSQEVFRAMIAQNAFIEFEEVYPGRFYGTPVSELEAANAAGEILVLDLDVQGARRIKEKFGPGVLTLFVAPPSLEVLEARLRARGTETEESLQTRLARARFEMDQAPHFDKVIVNDTLDRAVAETLEHLAAYLPD